MKQTVIILMIICAVLTACNSTETNENLAWKKKVQDSQAADNGQLTTEKVKNALNIWNNNRGIVAMKGSGVREIPAQNAAIVEISVSNFTFNQDGGGTKTITTGNGNVTISHFIDGRWVLNKVVIDDGYWNWSFEPNIEVK